MDLSNNNHVELSSMPSIATCAAECSNARPECDAFEHSASQGRCQLKFISNYTVEQQTNQLNGWQSCFKSACPEGATPRWFFTPYDLTGDGSADQISPVASNRKCAIEAQARSHVAYEYNFAAKLCQTRDEGLFTVSASAQVPGKTTCVRNSVLVTITTATTATTGSTGTTIATSLSGTSTTTTATAASASTSVGTSSSGTTEDATVSDSSGSGSSDSSFLFIIIGALVVVALLGAFAAGIFWRRRGQRDADNHERGAEPIYNTTTSVRADEPIYNAVLPSDKETPIYNTRPDFAKCSEGETPIYNTRPDFAKGSDGANYQNLPRRGNESLNYQTVSGLG